MEAIEIGSSVCEGEWVDCEREVEHDREPRREEKMLQQRDRLELYTYKTVVFLEGLRP